ncbi:MAG: 2,4-dihydroxyhept-2-ene-1,7-dioic acid aldolase, partial [Sulfobacillus thermosulfidooxidans]
SNKDFEQVSLVLDQLGLDFLVYSGIETLCFPMLAIGGAGHISATANLLPTPVADLYNYVRDNRWHEARELHYQLLALNQALFWETNPGPLKTAMALMGKIQPVIRLPLTLLDPHKTEALRQILIQYRLLPETGEARA